MSTQGILLPANPEFTTAGGGGGVNSINGDNAAAQLLSVGVAGVDFAIVDAGGGSHVFNLPTASALNRGALSAANWSAFNAKIGGVGVGGQVAFFSAGTTITSDAAFLWDNVNKRFSVGSAGLGLGNFIFTSTATIGTYNNLASSLIVGPAADSSTAFSAITGVVNNSTAHILSGSNYAGVIGVAEITSAGSSLTSTRAAGVYARFLQSDGTTGTINGVAAEIFSAGGTATTAIALHALPIFGAATTITNAYGLKVDAPGTGTNQFTMGIDTGVSYIGGSLLVGAGLAGAVEQFEVRGTGRMTGGRFLEAKGADVASANDLSLGVDGNTFLVTGVTTVNAITNTGWPAGSRIVLQFNNTITLKNNTAGGAGTSPMKLTTGADTVAVNGSILTFTYDGSFWWQENGATGGGGGNISGAIQSPEIAFGTGVNTIGGDVNFVWITGTKRLGINNSAPTSFIHALGVNAAAETNADPITITGGNGGNSAGVAAGGHGSSWFWTGGIGGAASNPQNAGEGGSFNWLGGKGGNADAAIGAANDGGDGILSGGSGGDGTAALAAANGGDLILAGGPPGTNNGGGAGLHGTIRLQSGLVFQRSTSAAGNYTVLSSDYLIGKTGITGGGDTVTLLNAATVLSGSTFVIKDESGTAGTNNITIATGGGNIDGAATVVINTNYGSVTVYSNGTNYFII